MANERPCVPDLFGLQQQPTLGRLRLVEAAISLFYRHGFGAVGIDQVVAEAGVTKSTFYKHFTSREELMVAAIERRDEWESAAWSRLVHERAGDDPRAQLLAMLDVVDLWLNDPQFRGCMVGNAAIEFPNPHDPVHQAAARVQRRIRDRRRDLARAAGADPATAESFADAYTALLAGAIVLRETQGRDDAARAIKPVVEQLIATMLPPASAARASDTPPAAGTVPSP